MTLHTSSSALLVGTLKDYQRRHYVSDISRLPGGVGDLVSTNSFAFLIGAVFDRGMPWRKAWSIPYELNSRGMLDSAILAGMTEPELATLLESLPVRPRYGCVRGAETLKDSAMLVGEFHGDTAAIWRDVLPPVVEKRLQRIRNVGPGIASMVVRILHDDWGRFGGWEQEIDVKPDVHVMRVFKRAGFISIESEDMARNAARELNPDFPGELDWPAWEIGQKWCKAREPKCSSCPLGSICPKYI